MSNELSLLRQALVDDVAWFILADWYEEHGELEIAAKIRSDKKLIKKIEFSPAFDKGAKGGIHGAEMRWVLTGPRGAVQFLVFTNWHLDSVQEQLRDTILQSRDHVSFCLIEPSAADIGYHSLKPIYEGQNVMQEDCPYLGGRPCYYNGSGLAAEGVLTILKEQGSEAVWKYLEEYYAKTFGE